MYTHPRIKKYKKIASFGITFCVIFSLAFSGNFSFNPLNKTKNFGYSAPSEALAGYWYNIHYKYCRVLTINSGPVATTTTGGFALYYATTTTALKATSSAGKIEKLSGGLPVDVVYTQGSNCDSAGSLLDFYHESYASTTGALSSWIEVMDLSSTTNKTILMYYGNGTATDLQDETGTFGALGEVAVYDLRENPATAGSSGITNSVSTTLHNGTATSGMLTSDSVTGKVGKAINFDGTNDVLNFGTNGGLDLTAGTVLSWINFDTIGLTSNKTFWSKNDATNAEGNIRGQLRQLNDATNHNRARLLSFTPSTGLYADNARVATTTWTHVGFTFSASAVLQQAYLDGAFDNSTTSNNAMDDTTSNFYVGALGGTSGALSEYFDGKIDDVRIYNRVLSTSDIKTIYENTNDVDTFWSEASEVSVPTTLRVSGTLYSNEGTTPITSGKTIKLAVGTSTVSVQSTSTDSGVGTFHFNITNANLTSSTSLVMWVDGDSSTRAAVVTKIPGVTGEFTGVNLYQNHVIVRHEGTALSDAIRIEDMAVYDATDDTDIQFNASSTATTKLSVNKGTELYVWANKVFVPSGNVVVNGNAGSSNDGSFELAAGASYKAATGKLTVAGNFTIASTSVFLPHTEGVLFNATTTGKIIDADTTTYAKDLGDFTFNGSGGGWTINANATTSDLSITTGTLTVSSGVDLALTGNYSNSGTFSNAGTVTMGPGLGWYPAKASAFAGPYSITAQESAPRGMAFKPDGTKMYIIGNVGNEVNEYTLSTAWDVNTRSHVTQFSTAAETAAWSLVFSPDGSTLYANAGGGKVVYVYTLSTPWSISTASYTGTKYALPNAAGGIDGYQFSPNGRQLFTLEAASRAIRTYNLSVPWEVSSSSVTYLESYSVNAQDTDPNGFVIKADGTTLYVVGRTGDDVNYYTLSNPWNVGTSSVTFVGALLDIATQEPDIREVAFSTDGTRMITIGNAADLYSFAFDQQSQKFSGTLTGNSALGNVNSQANALTTFVNNASTTNLTLNKGTTTLPSKLSVAGNFTNNATLRNNGGTVYLTGSSKTLSGDLVDENKFNTLYVSGSYTASNNASTTGMTIGSSGSFTSPSKLTLEGNYTNSGTFTHNSGTLTVGPGEGFDLSTGAVLGSGKSVNPDDATTRGVTFKPDGTRMYVVGDTGDEINQYTVSTPWLVSSIGATSTKGIGGQTTTPRKINFTPDGKTMYAIDSGTTGNIYQYYLTTPWLVTTAVYRRTITTTATQTVTPRDFAFSADGMSMYVLDNLNNIFTYTLSTPFDAATLTYASIRYNVNSQETVAHTFQFKPDGTVLYVAGQTGDDVNVYNLATPWTVSSSSISFVNAPLSIAGQEGAVRGMSIKPDGTRLYVIGNNNTVYTYSLKESTQTLSGTLTGVSAFNSLTIKNSATTSFASNASTSNLTISSGTTSAPSILSLTGDYTNNSKFKANSGLVVFRGIAQQTATGTMTGTSAFKNLTISNTAGSGVASQSVIFGRALTISDTFKMNASTSARFLAGATTTAQNLDLQGTSASSVWLRSSTNGSVWYLDADGTKTVKRVNVRDSNAAASSGGITDVNGTDATGNTNWTFNSVIVGSSTLANHQSGQTANTFSSADVTNGTLFRFKLTQNGEQATTTDTVFTLGGVKKVSAGIFSSIRLLRDNNSDGLYDASDTSIAGSGVMTISGQAGTITFTTDWKSTTTRNYILVANWSAPQNGSFMQVTLPTSGITSVGISSLEANTIYGSADTIQHSRNNKGGGGGGGGAIGGDAPAGAGQQGGGGGSGGEVIGTDPNFFWPSANSGSWTNGANAYDQTDGTYATTNSAVTHSYTNHGFSVPSGNAILGIEVKLEVSGSTAAGTIDVQLSWDGGTSWTSVKTTPTLTTSDVVATLGSPSNTWGRTWSSTDFSNANFAVRLTGAPSSNTLKVDAIQVRVYHQTGGGGGGGGSEI